MSMLDHPDRFIPTREDEREFLLQRAVFGDSTWVGVSSDHMLWHALNKKRGLPDWFPMDKGDLGRCEETYRRAPEHLRRRMLRVLKVFRQAVAEGGLFCHGCRTGGHNSTLRNLCRDCQRTSGPQAPNPKENHASEAGTMSADTEYRWRWPVDDNCFHGAWTEWSRDVPPRWVFRMAQVEERPA